MPRPEIDKHPKSFRADTFSEDSRVFLLTNSRKAGFDIFSVSVI